MKKKYTKILSALIIVILVTLYCNTSLALISTSFKGSAVEGTDYGKKISKVLGIALDVVRTVGISIAVLMMMVLGSKYMLASAGERAEIKKYAVTYIIGAIVLVASAGIATILKNFTGGLF